MAIAIKEIASARPARRRRALRRVARPDSPRSSTLSLIVAAAVIGPRLWGHDALAQHVDARLQTLARLPAGTDRFGRDLLARLLTGARWSLSAR